MSYRIEFKRSAAKYLKRVPVADRRRLRDKIDSFFIDKLPAPEKTKMKGNNPFHRVRVGDYRIVYEIHEDPPTVIILKIGHRKDVYRKLS